MDYENYEKTPQQIKTEFLERIKRLLSHRYVLQREKLEAMSSDDLVNYYITLLEKYRKMHEKIRNTFDFYDYYSRFINNLNMVELEGFLNSESHRRGLLKKWDDILEQENIERKKIDLGDDIDVIDGPRRRL